MKHHIFTIAALATALFASCSSEDELTQNAYPADNVVRVTANVNDIQTRASYTTSTLTEFGLSIQNFKNEKYCYGNKKVTKSGSTWTPAPQMLWENKDQEVNIFAYAPYNSSYTGNIYQETRFPVSVSTDQTSDNDKSDFLLFKYSGFKPTTGVVPIIFNHALSQLNVNISFGNEFSMSALLTKNPITEVKVNGTKVNAVCNFVTQEITAVETASPVSAKNESFKAATTENPNAKATYSCILIPQTVAANNFRIDVTIAMGGSNKTYTWSSAQQVQFDKGYSYQLDLTLGKDVVAPSKMSVGAWNEASSSTLTTE